MRRLGPPERELVLARLHRRLELRVVPVELRVAAEHEPAAIGVRIGNIDSVVAHALRPLPELLLLRRVELGPFAAVGRH
jgi:hypothetical protein